MPVRAVFRWIAWLLVLAIAAFTLLPVGLRPVTSAPADLERFVAFAIIGGAFYLGYPNHHVGFVLLALGLAGLLEALQNVVPGRHGQFHDYAIKAGGVFLGAVLARSVERKLRSRQQRFL